jgi:hypothetical protein
MSESPFTILKRWSLRPPHVPIRGASTGKGGVDTPPIDPAFKRLLMYLLVGTKGGFNRLQIMKLIHDEPLNLFSQAPARISITALSPYLSFRELRDPRYRKTA